MNRSRLYKYVPLTLILLALLSVAQGSYYVWVNRKEALCQVQINEQQNARTRALVQSADEERNSSRRVDDAFAALVLASLKKPPPNQAEARRLVTELYNALSEQARARSAADDARQKNPPPPEVDEACS